MTESQPKPTKSIRRFVFHIWITDIRWNKGMIIGIMIIVFLVILAVVMEISILLGIQITPYNPISQNVGPPLNPPSNTYLMGTDQLGRDLFSRVLVATPNAIFLGFTVIGFSLALGLAIGSFAGYRKGLIDEAMMRMTDVFFAIPALLLAVAFVAALDDGLFSLLLALMIVWWPPYARLARGETLRMYHHNYIEAARISGYGSTTIILRHVIPNIFPTLVAYATLDIGTVILAYSGLSYLGLSVSPPAPDLGQMVFAYQDYLITASWLPLFPGFLIALCAIGFSILGDGFQETLTGK